MLAAWTTTSSKHPIEYLLQATQQHNKSGIQISSLATIYWAESTLIHLLTHQELHLTKWNHQRI